MMPHLKNFFINIKYIYIYIDLYIYIYIYIYMYIYIYIYSTFNEGQAVVIERFNRTLKNIMWKYFTSNNTRF